MPVHGNNATPPAPAIAPGAEALDPARIARELGQRGMDPRVTALVPGFDAPFFQAGLAGYSDAAMRIIARRHGAPFCVTEALLDRMLLGGGHGFDKADLELLADALPCGGEDHPLAGQIIGGDPDEMAAGALKMIEQGARQDREYRRLAYADGVVPAAGSRVEICGQDMGVIEGPEGGMGDQGTGDRVIDPSSRGPSVPSRSFAVIDVNLACPVKKIDRKHRGGHWLTAPEGAIEILRAVRAAVPAHVPCTVKLRRAYDDTSEMARNFEVIFNAAYELGYAWATVHARTVEQKYVGPSRWTFLKDLCSRHGDKVIFGSGDVWGVHDIFRMIGYAGVTGVSVARGCIGNPWIFRQARQMLAGEAPSEPTIPEQRAVLLEHFDLSVALHGEKNAGRMMRKFAIKFAQHHLLGDEVKGAMIRVETTAQWRDALDAFYAPGRGADQDGSRLG